MTASGSEPPLSEVEYQAFAMRIAQRDVPRTIVWVGTVAALFTLINSVVPPAMPLSIMGGTLLLSGVLVLGGLSLRRPSTPPWHVPWVFAGLVTLFVWWLTVVFLAEGSESVLIYIAVAMTGVGPLCFAWRPFVVGGTLMLVGSSIGLALADEARQVDWEIGFAAALVISGVLLRLRLRLLRELADAERAAAAMATSDALTGLLNRRGLDERLPAVWSESSRRGEPISVYFLDVRGLKVANDEYGHDVGDQALCDVADAIRATVRGGDLAVRWGGDEFVIVGIGDGFTAIPMSERLNDRFRATSRIRQAGWIGAISVGHAYGFPNDHDFESLLLAADEDMYTRRAGPDPTRTVTPIMIGGTIHYYATCMRCAHSTTAHRRAELADRDLKGHRCEAASGAQGERPAPAVSDT